MTIDDFAEGNAEALKLATRGSASAARPLTGDTQRTLIYVVPSDGRRKPPPRIGADGPSWRKVAVAGLLEDGCPPSGTPRSTT